MKRIRLFTFLTLLSVMFLSMTCGEEFPEAPYDSHFEFKLSNLSDEEIYFLLDYDISPTPMELKKYDFNAMLTLKANETTSYSVYSVNDAEKMYVKILIVKKSKLGNTPISELKDNSMFDKELILSYEDLKAKEFKVTYDGKD